MVAGKQASAGKQRSKELKKEKQELKTAKKLSKATNNDEGDIVAIVESLHREAAAESATSGQPGFSNVSPKPRTSFTFIYTRQGFILFGGEHYDAKVCKVFKDCYKWNPEKSEGGSCWKSAVGGLSPTPRVGHASCLTNDEIYIHGGEFATNSQFYHYKDLWKLDIKTLKWTAITSASNSSPPSARSGHKMVNCRNLLLVFGGFHDNGREVRYFNELYSFTPAIATWRKLTVKNPPPVRSAAVVATNNDFLVVSGGFSKTRDTDRDCKGTFHEDIWSLDLRFLFENKESDLCWTKSKRRALTRSGVAYCQHKNLVYAFGGVVDNDAGGNSYNSSFFYNDVWQFDLISKQWQRIRIDDDDTRETAINSPQLAYRPRRTHMECVMLDVDLMKKTIKEAEQKRNNEPSKNRSRDLNLSRAGLIPNAVENVVVKYTTEPTDLRAPLPRSNSAVAIKDGYLYLYGGGIELSGNRILLFDDAWRFHLRNHTWELVVGGEYWKSALLAESDSTSSSDSDLEGVDDSDASSEDLSNESEGSTSSCFAD